MDYSLPHRLKRLRIKTMSGNSTTGHTDGFRGTTMNMFIPHDEGGSLMVRPWPEFKTSVVLLDGELYIPFELHIGHDELRMIGLDDRKEMDGKATYHVFHASDLNRLQPCGKLKHAVAGTDHGLVQVVPFLNKKRTEEMTRSTGAMKRIRLRYLFDNAKKNPHEEGFVAKMKNTTYRLGKVPHKWYFFYGWRYIHWWEGDPSVRRTHGFFRLIEENISGGNYPSKNQYHVDHRKRR